MTTLQIFTDDKKKIEEFLALAISKFDFKVKIADEQSFKNTKQNEISTKIDQQIKNAKVINTKKAEYFISAVEKADKFIDQEKAKLSLNEAKEQYFKDKFNLK